MPEGTQLEYKESLDPSDSHDRLVLVKEIVAMSNADGGTIRVGVSNDGNIIGVPAPVTSRGVQSESSA